MNGNAYVCLYDRGAMPLMQFGLLDEIIPKATRGLDKIAVAGHHRDIILKGAGKNVAVHDSGIEASCAATFLDMDYPYRERGRKFPDVAIPVTEDSEVFYGQT